MYNGELRLVAIAHVRAKFQGSLLRHCRMEICKEQDKRNNEVRHLSFVEKDVLFLIFQPRSREYFCHLDDKYDKERVITVFFNTTNFGESQSLVRASQRREKWNEYRNNWTVNDCRYR